MGRACLHEGQHKAVRACRLRRNFQPVEWKRYGHLFSLLLLVFFELTPQEGLVSYYLARVLETVGITSKTTQNQVNLGLNCWNLITGFTASYLVSITPRRVMYLTSVTGMFITFAAWTGASASFSNTHNSGAASAVVAMIFLYCGSPPSSSSCVPATE